MLYRWKRGSVLKNGIRISCKHKVQTVTYYIINYIITHIKHTYKDPKFLYAATQSQSAQHFAHSPSDGSTLRVSTVYVAVFYFCS
jgi:hypothetical protein